jgi:sensor histidine kinase YesM
VGALIRGGSITIRARRQEQRLIIEVIDDGPGFGSTTPSERVGLGNTRERLRAAFAGDHHLRLAESVNGGAVVRIDIPYQEDAAEPVESLRD